MEVGDALYKLNEVDGRLTRARSFLHRFEPDKVREVSQEGLDLAASAQSEGEAALEELGFRRTGLVLSLVVIAVLGAALYLKIRTLDR
ncbi:MAG: hypothetical protein ABIL09_27005, partial [Gemmatimonadota bacterium]